LSAHETSRGRAEPRLRILVLGSAAGGGFPQWNCLCSVCRLAWNGDARVKPRTQSSIAASVDGRSWLLLNASPDLRAQILAQPRLSPVAVGGDDERRASPIAGVLVTNGDVDHLAGLLTLREKQPLDLFATAGVHAVLADDPIFGVLDRDLVSRRTVAVGEDFEPLPRLSVELFPVPGKVPLYLEGETVEIGGEGEMTVGVRLSDGGRTAFYVPGCAAVTPALRGRVKGADLLLFDGTVFHDDEMQRAGVGAKTGRRMGHVPIAGEGGSLGAFDGLGIAARTYIHVNNTNPILVEGSLERQAVEAAGWRVAEDGQEISP
jgi:pyrroloquinoline quinone biosynthesis protein B